MKKIITLEQQPFINQLKKDLLEGIESEANERVKFSTINSLLNFSKSLKIIPSTSVKGLNLEMITN